MNRTQLQKRLLLAAVTLLGGALAALWVALPNHDLSVLLRPDEWDARDADVVLASLPHGERAPSLEAGTQVLAGRYAVDYTMSLTAPSATGPHTGEMALQGTLEIAAAKERGWFVGRVVAPKVTADATLVPLMGTRADAPGAGFELPFAARLDDDGAIVELRHAKAAPMGARNLIKGLLHASQIVRTEDDVAHAEWTVVEPGADEDIEASYSLRENQLTKTWHSKQLGGERKAAMTAIGKVDMSLAAHTVRDVTWSLHVHANLGMGMGDANYDGEVRAELRWLGQSQGDWARGVDVLGLEVGLGKLRVRAPRPVIAVAPGATADGLIAAASAAAAKRDNNARRKAMQQLATLVKREPALAKTLAARLRAPLPGDDRRTLVEALASSDTVAGREELAGIMDDDVVEGELRADVATVTTFMPRPGDKLLASLRRQSEQAGLSRLGSAALFALAGQARLQADRDPARTAQMNAELLKRAQAKLTLSPTAIVHAPPVAPAGQGMAPEPQGAAGPGSQQAGETWQKGDDLDTLKGDDGTVTPGPTGTGGALPTAIPTNATFAEQLAWLEAVGTIGGPEVLKLVKPWLKHPNHQVRMTATFALRFAHTGAARIELVNQMALDKDGWVRRAAVMATRYHAMAPFLQPVQRALKEDVHPNVRLAAAYNLAMWAHEAPTLMSYVREAANREPKPLVARAMRDLEPMLIRDTPDGSVTMEPVLPHGAHPPSVPHGVQLVARQAPETAATQEGALSQDTQAKSGAPKGAQAGGQ